jgi:hypothetical protein
MLSGVVGPVRGIARDGWECSRSGLERPTRQGESPVDETPPSVVALVPEYRGTRGIPRESGGTTLQGYILVRDR